MALPRRIDALDWRKDRRNEDLTATLIACAGHARLATFADAGFYMHIINDIARKVDTALDPPEQRREIVPASCAIRCSPLAKTTSG